VKSAAGILKMKHNIKQYKNISNNISNNIKIYQKYIKQYQTILNRIKTGGMVLSKYSESLVEFRRKKLRFSYIVMVQFLAKCLYYKVEIGNFSAKLFLNLNIGRRRIGHFALRCVMP
jgi:hypothetical protein